VLTNRLAQFIHHSSPTTHRRIVQGEMSNLPWTGKSTWVSIFSSDPFPCVPLLDATDESAQPDGRGTLWMTPWRCHRLPRKCHIYSQGTPPAHQRN
jgi:hypothetical protein